MTHHSPEPERTGEVGDDLASGAIHLLDWVRGWCADCDPVAETQARSRHLRAAAVDLCGYLPGFVVFPVALLGAGPALPLFTGLAPELVIAVAVLLPPGVVSQPVGARRADGHDDGRAGCYREDEGADGGDRGRPAGSEGPWAQKVNPAHEEPGGYAMSL